MCEPTMRVKKKTCSACHRWLVVATNFYAHVHGKDGYFAKCKECVKQAVKDHRAANPEKFAVYERERWERPERKQAVRESLNAARLRDPERFRRYARESIARYPEKRKARAAVNHAIRDGKLSKSACEDCGAVKVQAHHDDYAKPLEVTWLCARCHGRRHRDGSVGRKRRYASEER